MTNLLYFTNVDKWITLFTGLILKYMGENIDRTGIFNKDIEC